MGGETLEVMLYDYHDYQRNDGGATLCHHHQQPQLPPPPPPQQHYQQGQDGDNNINNLPEDDITSGVSVNPPQNAASKCGFLPGQDDDVGFAVQLCAFVDASQVVDEDERRLVSRRVDSRVGSGLLLLLCRILSNYMLLSILMSCMYITINPHTPYTLSILIHSLYKHTHIHTPNTHIHTPNTHIFTSLTHTFTPL